MKNKKQIDWSWLHGILIAALMVGLPIGGYVLISSPTTLLCQDVCFTAFSNLVGWVIILSEFFVIAGTYWAVTSPNSRVMK